nr:hypothetical protein [Tanacetum cinerariifolium]
MIDRWLTGGLTEVHGGLAKVYDGPPPLTVVGHRMACIRGGSRLGYEVRGSLVGSRGSLAVSSGLEVGLDTRANNGMFWEHTCHTLIGGSRKLQLSMTGSHMKISKVVNLKTFSRYGYTYLKEIVLRRVDYQDYKITEADFKNLHLNDFADLYLLHLQGKLNHLSGLDKVSLFNAVNLWIRNIVIRHRMEDLQLGVKSYHMKLNLTQPSWDASDFLFKEDYNIVQKPRAIIYRDRNNQKKMMRETKSEDDKRRSKEFIEVIERRLKIRRIFTCLKSFVSGRLRDVDYKLIQRTNDFIIPTLRKATNLIRSLVQIAIKHDQPKNSNELFQKLLEDLKSLAEYKESLENSSKEIAISSSNPEKEEPPQDSDIHQLIEECSTEISEEQKQSMEDTMLELVKICQEKEFLCIHDNVEDLIESALNSKLLLINSNSQRLDKKEQEVKNVVEQPTERGNHSIQSLQNFKVVHKISISLKNTSQNSSIHAVTPILSIKEPEHSLSMGYEHLSITPEMESDEVTKSNAENLLPIPSECEVTLEDKKEYFVESPIEIFIFHLLSLRTTKFKDRVEQTTRILPPVIEVFLYWIFVPVSKIFTSFD